MSDYSLASTAFTSFRECYQFSRGHYRSDRIGIYHHKDQGEAGYVDADWFHYDYAGPLRQNV